MNIATRDKKVLKLPKLNLPYYELDIKSSEGKLYVYDIIRKKRIVLTPEEWVRQNLIHHLIKVNGFSKSLIKIESGLKYNQRLKRSDILIYSNDGMPYLLVECKSINTKIHQSTFDQVALYNQTIRAQFVMISNGQEHYCCEMDFENNSFKFIEEIPKSS